MRFQVSLFFFGICLLSGCSKGPDCEGVSCEPDNIGEINPDKSFLYLIQHKGDTAVKFITNAGFSFQFYPSGIYSGGGEGEEIYLATTTKDPCCGALRQVASSIHYRQDLNSRDANMTLFSILKKNVPWHLDNISQASNYSDILDVGVQNTSFRMSVYDSVTRQQYKGEVDILDSLKWGDFTYNHVYHFHHDTLQSSAGPIGLYYTKDDGIIGFYFKNGSKWYRKK